MTLEIPELVEKALGDTPEQARRRALECVVVEGYKSERLSRGEVRRLLDLSWYGTEELLSKYGAYLHYSIEDLDDDLRTFSKLSEKTEATWV